MFFKTFSTTFIVFFLVGLSPQHVEGMRNPRVIMRTGQGQVQALLDPKTFSLPELSFLIKILDSVEIDEVYNVNNFEDIQDILVEKGTGILNAQGLSENNRNISHFRIKIQSVAPGQSVSGQSGSGKSVSGQSVSGRTIREWKIRQ